MLSFAQEQEILRASQENPQELLTLCQLHFSEVYHFAYFALGEQIIAEEKTQQIFREAVIQFIAKNKQEAEGRIVPKTFFLKVAAEQLEGHTPQPAKKLTQELHNAINILPKNEIKALTPEERRLIIQELLPKLKWSYRLALILHLYHERPTDEIAQILNKTPTAIELRLKHAWNELQAEFQQQGKTILQQHEAIE